MAAWSDLDEVLWSRVSSFMYMDEQVQFSVSSFGCMTLMGGFEYVQEANHDFWRLVDFWCTIQEELANQAEVWAMMDLMDDEPYISD